MSSKKDSFLYIPGVYSVNSVILTGKLYVKTAQKNESVQIEVIGLENRQ